MALLGNGKGYSKKDINFFEEYTAAARKTARYLAYFIFAALVVIAVFVIWWFVSFFTNRAIKKDIQMYQDKLASEEYINIENMAAQYEAELSRKNQQLYAMSSLRNTVDTTSVASTNLLDLLIANIPEDAYIDSYELNGDNFIINGYSFTYASALNLTHLLQDAENIFNADIPTQIIIDRVNDVEVIDEDTGNINPINCYYSFKIVGRLTNKVTVSVSSFATVNGQVIALGAIQSQKYEYNDPENPYVAENITNITYANANYTLSSITINGVAISGEQLAEVLATGTHTITNLTDDISVQYYYNVAVAATEGGEA